MSCHEINDLSASPDTVSWQRINFQEARKRVKSCKGVLLLPTIITMIRK